MSDNWIILIPESSDYIPSQDRQDEAAIYFRSIAPASDEIKTETTERIRFIDCGSNLERIMCPACLREIGIDWWQDQMDSEGENDFPLKPIALPCCTTPRSLNDLLYHWPQGFTRFSIEAMNPNIGDLPEDQQKELESILGCKTKKILQHL